MVLTHGIVCSSNPQRPRGGRRCGGKMLWFVKTQTTEENIQQVNLLNINYEKTSSLFAD